MLSLTGLVAAIAMAGLMQLPYIAGNADPATGHIRNVKPTQAWLDKNKPSRMTREIQASECGMNTRLSYPNVQLFAWFKVNHGEDNYHGCPYGDCWAFTTHPGPDDVELDFLDSYTFFWHGIAGVQGTGVKLISDPQSGALGYEQSLSGKFLVGPTPMGTLQVDHDEHYPGFDRSKLVPWPKGAVNRFLWGPPEPEHLKCGRPCEENRDPGIKPGAYGSKMYTPAPASAYPPPPSWVPGPEDKCGKNGTIPVPDKCASFCSCASHCKDDNCISQCGSKGNKCDKSKCPALPPPSPNPPQPGHDSDKCLNYCSCMEQCKDDKQCFQSNCKKIKHGCENDQCNSNPPPSSNPTPPATDPTTPPSYSSGSKNPGQAPKEQKKKPKKKKQHKSGNGNTGSDGTGSDGTGSDGNGSEGTGSKGTGSDGTGSDGTGSDGTGSEGTGSDSGSGGKGNSGSGSKRVSRQKVKACL